MNTDTNTRKDRNMNTNIILFSSTTRMTKLLSFRIGPKTVVKVHNNTQRVMIIWLDNFVTWYNFHHSEFDCYCSRIHNVHNLYNMVGLCSSLFWHWDIIWGKNFSQFIILLVFLYNFREVIYQNLQNFRTHLGRRGTWLGTTPFLNQTSLPFQEGSLDLLTIIR